MSDELGSQYLLRMCTYSHEPDLQSHSLIDALRRPIAILKVSRDAEKLPLLPLLPLPQNDVVDAHCREWN